MQKFYRLKSGTFSSLGPFYQPGSASQAINLFAPWGILTLISDAQLGHAPRSLLIDKFLRNYKFPGVFKTEKPARGSIDCPAKADITNHSTLTMNDGWSGPVVFEFTTGGGVTPGNEEVDITGATTGADVAAILAAAIATYVASLGLSPAGGGQGFLANVRGSIVFVVQAFPAKNLIGSPHSQPARGTWYGKTTGDFGNQAIVPSVPGEWAGRLRGMTGGKQRSAGLFARVIPGSRSQALPGFVPLLEPPIG